MLRYPEKQTNKRHSVCNVWPLPLQASNLYAHLPLSCYITHSATDFSSSFRVQPDYQLTVRTRARHYKENGTRELLLLRCVVRLSWSPPMTSSSPVGKHGFSFRHSTWSFTILKLKPHKLQAHTRDPETTKNKPRHYAPTSKSSTFTCRTFRGPHLPCPSSQSPKVLDTIAISRIVFQMFLVVAAKPDFHTWNSDQGRIGSPERLKDLIFSPPYISRVCYSTTRVVSVHTVSIP